ncbi:GNAT family N-acetyltransferase [Marivita hallyeonensis]|uniref:Acetyltransferase (GNAT) family protein n=1 Tax=Marivita hallyeonensis TaxID=996342 RepID=A0A1M5P1Y6_9RHOB|nr:GNAT family N-acetyltransferase [Marivita hallyeonensis]SHG95792.1 Acetyltransferase (GNAT) family protein [Marivita hallyeonensis]
MELIEPELPRVLPLFRALHAHHADLAPDVYHCDGSDSEYLAHLEEKRVAGARFFAHDTGEALASYLIALPVVVPGDALRHASRTVRVDHLYVSPDLRGMGLAKALIGRVEAWVGELGFDGWWFSYHAVNDGVAKAYHAMGASPWTAVSAKRM